MAMLGVWPVRILILGCSFRWGAGLVARKSSTQSGWSDLDTVPDVIIAGIGNSGTRGVKQLMETLGLRMCKDINENEDNIETSFSTNSWVLDQLTRLISEGRKLSVEAYEKYPDSFQRLLMWQREKVAATYHCALPNSDEHAIWGFKNPSQLYMWPVTHLAYAGRTKLLLVTRDPRDICTAENQNQFEAFCPGLLGRACSGESDCYSFWARVWSDVLAEFVPKGNVKLVRIEDLAVREPAMVRSKVRCILNYAGLTAPPSSSSNPSLLSFEPTQINDDVIEKSLIPIHEHSSSFMGHHYNATDQDRREHVALTSNHNDPLVKQMMLRLGYDPKEFALLPPWEESIC
mmetsp:Transcript_35999/g.64707  ORF Transcript_35999/g.64707 Transcript_35999/m.64707 type:complete len:346 (+) Transcript_35999:52-1089(+)